MKSRILPSLGLYKTFFHSFSRQHPWNSQLKICTVHYIEALMVTILTILHCSLWKVRQHSAIVTSTISGQSLILGLSSISMFLTFGTMWKQLYKNFFKVPESVEEQLLIYFRHQSILYHHTVVICYNSFTCTYSTITRDKCLSPHVNDYCLLTS